VVFAAIVASIQSSKDPNSGLEEARQDVAGCEADRAREALRDPRVTEGWICPTVEELRTQYDKRFRYAETMPDVSRGVAIPLFALSLLVGASFVGAEWGTGSLATLLTWEPRRGRVLVAKVVVCALLLAVSVAILLAFVAVVFYPVAVFRGTTQGVTGSMWWTLAGIWARAGGLAIFAGAIGGGLATLTRNTAGGLGAGLVYALIADPLLGQWRQGRYRPWLLMHLFPRLLGLPVDVPSRGPPGSFGETLFEVRQLSPTRPLVLLSIYAAGLIAIAYASFRARDVT
jgi:ABC-2 type transport system permease protein